ncbi:MAG TPA: hypothetical protein ENI95_12465, partial [Chloroflexi bacterium]|nr:hypothetical protein [Chloroflexota bacterium]
MRIPGLLLVLAALGALGLYFSGWLVPFPLPGGVLSPTPVIEGGVGPVATTIGAPLPTGITASPSSPVSVTPSRTSSPDGFTTPADQWANRLLDTALPVIEQPLPGQADGLLWWQGSDASHPLEFEEGSLTLGGG